MAYGDENTKLENFDRIIPENVFQEVTSITTDQFRFLRDGGDYVDEETGGTEHFDGHLFDPVVFDDSVKEFIQLRHRLANYFDENLREDIFDYVPPQKTNQIFTPRRVVAQLKRIRRIVDAVNHALEGHRFITLAATRIAVQYGIEIVRALQPAHLRLFGVANLQVCMQCLFVRQWLVAIVIYGKRHRQFTTDLNSVNGMKLRIRARNKLGKYIYADLTGIQCIAQQSIGRTFLIIMPETVAGKTMLGRLRSHMAAFETGIEPRENNGNTTTDGSAFLKVNRLWSPNHSLFAGRCPGKHMRTVIAD